TMAAAAGWGLGPALVHVIDREADSVGHYRRWHAAGHRFVVRAAHDRVVLHHGRDCSLAHVAASLANSFAELRDAEVRAASVSIRAGSGAIHVAETEVVLNRPARHYTGARTAT